MHIDSMLDSKVKDKVIVDMLNIAGIHPPSANDASIKLPSQLPGCGHLRLPPYQHLNINPNSDDLLQYSLQTSANYQSDNQTLTTSNLNSKNP